MGLVPSADKLPPVLLVDDDSDALFFIERRLRSAGIENPVETFFDGDDALVYLAECAERGRVLPCVLFIDVKPMGRDGFEIVARVRARSELRAMNIFVLTGSADPQHHNRAAELGTDGYLLKFPPAERLAEIVRSAMAAGSKVK